MDNEVQQRVLLVISDVLNIKINEISLDASLRDDLKIDSMNQLALFIALEDEFNRMIPPERVTEIATVKEIIDFIHKELQS